MSAPSVIAITDVAAHGEERTLKAMESLCKVARPGSVAVQLRDRALSVRVRLRLGQKLRHITAESGQGLWVNDRLDLAVLLSADVLHVPRGAVPLSVLRVAIAAGPHKLRLSAPVHDLRVGSEADIHLVSPVFASRKGAPALGLAALSGYCKRHPSRFVYALGGVDATAATAALVAGAHGIAAIGAIYDDAESLVHCLALNR